MHENPLVLKEIEVEKRLAIEYYTIDKNLNDNLDKKEDKLPISKKSNFVSEKVDCFVQKLTSSMSMMTISKNQKSNPTPWSKTIHGFFETIFENDDQKQNSNPLPVKSKAKKRTLMSSGLIDYKDDDFIPTKVSREKVILIVKMKY
ncbi:unnamed protein product [Brachionus calyciflorus]|uniref:Uncharacterized protein n=1 Tax=Brachionus calyciflorus TaxID=104777 RepID=A0A814KC95_9BILA|nr:unnamed protein product [Brachionus calyciflorus]